MLNFGKSAALLGDVTVKSSISLGTCFTSKLSFTVTGRDSSLNVTKTMSFLNYQLKKAQVWEHQALVRARMIGGSESLTTAFNDCRHQVLCLARNEIELRKSVVSMRSRIVQENCRSTGEEYDLKVDRGGLLDIEFLLQYLILRWANQYPQLTKGTKNKTLIRALVDTRILASPDGELLGTILDKYLRTENLLKLQEKLTLIPKATLIEERKWISQLWQRFLEPDR